MASAASESTSTATVDLGSMLVTYGQTMADNEKLKAENQKLKAQVTESKAQINMLEQTIGKLQAKVAELQDKVGQYEQAASFEEEDEGAATSEYSSAVKHIAKGKTFSSEKAAKIAANSKFISSRKAAEIVASLTDAQRKALELFKDFDDDTCMHWRIRDLRSLNSALKAIKNGNFKSFLFDKKTGWSQIGQIQYLLNTDDQFCFHNEGSNGHRVLTEDEVDMLLELIERVMERQKRIVARTGGRN